MKEIYLIAHNRLVIREDGEEDEDIIPEPGYGWFASIEAADSFCDSLDDNVTAGKPIEFYPIKVKQTA